MNLKSFIVKNVTLFLVVLCHSMLKRFSEFNLTKQCLKNVFLILKNAAVQYCNRGMLLGRCLVCTQCLNEMYVVAKVNLLSCVKLERQARYHRPEFLREKKYYKFLTVFELEALVSEL